jgi:hypothetical protein
VLRLCESGLINVDGRILKTEVIEDDDEKLSAWSVVRLEIDLAVENIVVQRV